MCESNKDPNREYAHSFSWLHVRSALGSNHGALVFTVDRIFWLIFAFFAARRGGNSPTFWLALHFRYPHISDNSPKSRFRLSLFLFLTPTKLELAPKNQRSVTVFSATTKKGSVRVLAENPTWQILVRFR